MELFASTRHDELLARMRGGEKLVIADGRGKSRLVDGLARALGPQAVVVTVPSTVEAPDRTSYVALALARGCHRTPEVAEALTKHPGRIDAALEALRPGLERRLLLVDDLDELERPTTERWDLPAVFEPARVTLRSWLQENCALQTRARGREGSIKPQHGAPSPNERLDVDRLWRRSGQDVERFALEVTRECWLGPASEDAPSMETERLVQELWSALSPSLREVVALLVVHGVPIPRGDLEVLRVVDLEELRAAVDLGLVDDLSQGVSVPPAWARGVLIAPKVRDDMHERWGRAFEELARSTGPSQALAILEAHRHYAAVPRLLSRAAQLAQFGVGFLLAAARRASYDEQRFRDAASTYDLALQLDARVRESGDPEGIGALPRGYAIHYRAFNRYRAELDSPSETLSAYREALLQWPENALFWSRTVRCAFAADAYPEALRALDSATTRVPAHPLRDAVLVARTVEGLVRRACLLPALLVWGEHRPSTGAEGLAEERLSASLARDFLLDRVWARNAPEVRFRTPVVARVEWLRGSSACLSVLGREYRGESPARAVAHAARALLDELAELGLSASATEAGPDDRKQALAQIVDLGRLATGDEASRWIAYLMALDEQVRTAAITREQADTVRNLWRTARDRLAGLRRPTAGRDESGGVYLAWSFRSPARTSLTLEIARDGTWEWFFSAPDGRPQGSEEPAREPSEEVFDKLARFVQ